jgi:hypothetical protein
MPRAGREQGGGQCLGQWAGGQAGEEEEDDDENAIGLPLSSNDGRRSLSAEALVVSLMGGRQSR